MATLTVGYIENTRRLYKFAILILLSMIVLHGTYFRIRPSEAVPTLDWLVFARLLTCGIAFIVGITLIPKNVSWGFGGRILSLYVLATALSSFNSPYPILVCGYFVLLLGAGVLMIALVYRAQNIEQLEKIEKVWFITVSVLVIKDTITALVFPEMQPSWLEISRLGIGVTHANTLSLLAALIFWISFKQKRVNNFVFIWLFRSVLIFVIIKAISRVSIAAFLVGGLCYFLFKTKDRLNRWIKVFTVVGFLLSFFLLSLSIGLSWSKHVVDYLTRGQDKAGLSTLTGRTPIWQHIINKRLESPFVGHGYGVTRLTLGPIPNYDYQPSHSHNEILHVFFETGLIGLILFLVMLIYSLKWLKAFEKLQRTFSTDIAVHAICVLMMLLVTSFTEARLGGSLGPIHPIFFFYLLTLDREKHILKLGKIEES